MATLPNATYAAPGAPLYGSVGASNLFSSILILTDGNISSIVEAYPGATRWQALSSGTVYSEIRQDSVFGEIVLESGTGSATLSQSLLTTNVPISTPQILSDTVGAVEIDATTVSTSILDIDGQTLTATTSNLLLNGIPIATTSNISSLADWALDPAISSVNMSGFDLLSTGTIFAQRGVFTDLSTITFTAQSTVHFVSTVSSLFLEAQQVNVSTLFASAFLSTPDIEVSSINGAAFGASSITVEVMGVSSLVANTISSLGAEIRSALFSTVQFNPSFNPNLNVNLNLGSLFGNLAGAAAGGIGVLVGAAGLGTGIAALAQGRQTNFINSNAYELVNGTTQLQISTLGTAFSTVYRFVSSPAENVPGEEIFISTIYPAGPAIRSMSDPLNTVSAPTSTIQSFGQWVSLADFAAQSTFSTFSEIVLTPSTLLYSQTADAELVVATPSDSNDFAQVACSALRLTSSSTASNGVVFFNSASNRLNFLDDATVNHTLAYTVDSVLQASTMNMSTATVQGQIIIEPSTLRSGVYMPFDAVNGTGVVAIGLSTSASIYENYAFWAAGVGTALGESVKELYTILETKDNEVSFQYADMQVGRVLYNGSNNYGAYTSGYITGDGAGNLSLVGSNVYVSSLAVSSVNGLPSHISSFNTVTTSSLTVSTLFGNWAQLSTVGVSSVVGIGGAANLVGFSNGTFSNVNISGLSTINLTTNNSAGTASQPAGRLIISGNDVDLQQQDLWCQQIRLGAGNPSGSAQTEIIFYSPDNLTTRGFGIGGQDRTVRAVSTINGGGGGYVLDTSINPPFFSSLGGVSSVLMSFFPSTSLSTIGVSTITNITPPPYYASVYSSTSQTVAAANTSTAATWNTTTLNKGGFTIGTSTIQVPVSGDYEITASFQFDTSSGGTNSAQFWLTKNGTAVAQTNSIVSVVNNGDTLGNVQIFDTAAANDKYGWDFYSSDANMTASATAAGATPAIPSIIANIKRLG